MLMKVYDKKGEMFEVTPDRAKHLTLEKGWSFSAQVVPLFKPTSPLAKSEESFAGPSAKPQEPKSAPTGPNPVKAKDFVDGQLLKSATAPMPKV